MDEEVEEHLHAPIWPRVGNPFLWWECVGTARYPLLSKVAQLYLSVPATQVSSEGLFSTTGNVVTATKDDLPEHVKQLVFVRSYMR